MIGTAAEKAVLTIWTVYKNPRDFPGHWVLRAHDVPGGPRADCFVSKNYLGVIRHLPMGMVRMTRFENDDPVIFETWI
jgi:hypothetical protein